MYKYINGYFDFVKSHPIGTDSEPIKGMSFEETEQLRLAYEYEIFPASVYEMANLVSLDAFKDCMSKKEREFWLKHLRKEQPGLKDIFILDGYLHDDVIFMPCGEEENPAIYVFNGGEKPIRLIYNTLEDYLIACWNGLYLGFQRDLAGRTELQNRVERAKAIFKPLYAAANKLISPHIANDNMDLALHWVKCLYKELFYNPYELKYHSNFDLWKAEAVKYNNATIKYIRLVKSSFESISTIKGYEINQLEIDFVNFATIINWVSASPDATIVKPSAEAKNAAAQKRDITDFLM
jgi:hypothetical protein